MDTQPENQPLEHSLDTILRPKSWDSYIGQPTIKNNLSVLINAAKERGQMPEHVLLHGPAGLGKTTLAYIIGSMLGLPVQTITGPMIERTGDIISVASTLEQGGVLFIDEIHGLNKNVEEALYPIMESGSISIMVGKGATARSVDITLPPLVVIAATTQIGKLSAPLRSRFSGGILRLNQYKNEDLSKIIQQSASLLNIKISKDAADAISKRSRSTPRIANYLLKRVRDYAQIHNKEITPKIVNIALSDRDIDEYGLTAEDRNVLFTMRDAFNGGPVGIQALATTLSEDIHTLEEVYEPFLIHTGFIQRTPRGRSLTDKGYAYLYTTENK